LNLASHTERKQQYPVMATCFRKLVDKSVRFLQQWLPGHGLQKSRVHLVAKQWLKRCLGWVKCPVVPVWNIFLWVTLFEM